MRGATRAKCRYDQYPLISIHTPHAGSDPLPSSVPLSHPYFNPHSPCGERLRPPEFYINFFRFQSTLPMRGATFTPPKASGVAADFNPHSPCGERLCHSAGHDLIKIFQSTLPMRGATMFWQFARNALVISIHTPHAGSDLGV